MKRLLFLLLFIPVLSFGQKVYTYSGDVVTYGGDVLVDDAFITIWNTENAGSATKTIVIPTTGAGYDCIIAWGDGTSEVAVGTPGNITHVYETAGIKTVKIWGEFPRIYFNNTDDKLKLLTITQWGDIEWGSMYRAFWGCANMDCVATDFANTAEVTTFEYAFLECHSLTSINVSGWNTAEVTSFKSAFSNCYLLTNLDVSGWNTAKVTSFERIFFNCYSLTSLDVSGWNTSKVTTFALAFYECRLLTALDVSGWNTSKVTTFAFAFYNCARLKSSFSALELTLCTNVTSMFLSSDINAPATTTNYDATLISFAGQAVTGSMSISFGTAKYGEGLVDSGTTDGTTADKLVQSGQNFITTVTIGDVIYNVTDDTYARVTGIDSDITLSLDTDIMISGEVYRIQHSDAAKARASLILDDLWTITDGGYYLEFDNGKLVISFDDNRDTQYSRAFPLLVSKGVGGTFYTIGSLVGFSGDYFTWLQAKEMSDAGMDIQCHTYDHSDLTTLTELQVIAELQDNTDIFTINDIPSPTVMAYPLGSSGTNDNVKSWVSGLRTSGRGSEDLGTNNPISPDSDRYDLPAYNVTTISDADLITLKSYLDQYLIGKAAMIIYMHSVSVEGASKMGEIIDYAQSLGIDIITHFELDALLE